MTLSASQIIRAHRSERTRRILHYRTTDGMRHTSRVDAVVHQRRLDWLEYPFAGPEPRTLDEWAARIDKLREEHGGQALLVVDSGYDGHEITVYRASRPDADPEDAI